MKHKFRVLLLVRSVCLLVDFFTTSKVLLVVKEVNFFLALIYHKNYLRISPITLYKVNIRPSPHV